METVIKNGYMFKIDDNKRHVVCEASVGHVARRWVEAIKKPLGFEYNGEDVFLRGGCREYFYGSFQEALDAIAYNKFDVNRVKTERLRDLKATCKLEQTNKRKRAVDSREGEYDFDRQFDVNPFYSTKRIEAEVKYITVEVDFSFNAGVSSRQIDEYAQLCFSSIEALENAGYRCTVYVVNSCRDMHRSGPLSRYSWDMRLLLKAADEYQSIQSYGKYFTTWFLRRCIFNAKAETFVVSKCDPRAGISSPLRKQCEAREGFIRLTPEIIGYTRTNLQPLKDLLFQSVGKLPIKKAA